MEEKVFNKAMRIVMESGTSRFSCEDFTNTEVLKQHQQVIKQCAANLLGKEGKSFVIDDNNRDVIQYLLLYFNDSPLAENVFPGNCYKNHRNILLCGESGVGKTMIMQLFSDYLKAIGSPRAFFNLSVTQMVNYYQLNSHIDKYTYNEKDSKGFSGSPVNICLNDIGLQTHLHFGTDTKVVVDDFLHARSEIYQGFGKFTHLTTNLTPKDLKVVFADGYGRLVDRFKMYNIIHLKGVSRRG